jgi:hypothetical protein
MTALEQITVPKVPLLPRIDASHRATRRHIRPGARPASTCEQNRLREGSETGPFQPAYARSVA